ncbi:hypothetical protein [Alteromonas antoniana]|uniref:hypothetical protein n=1 Tax=Alteromonas antoniana TaxID=2803813 RepID=UPI001C46EB3B|nr:hypothetical protein [Alteromonas antoniana]
MNAQIPVSPGQVTPLHPLTTKEDPPVVSPHWPKALIVKRKSPERRDAGQRPE